MAIINLKEALKCLGITSNSNFSIREKAQAVLDNASAKLDNFIARIGDTVEAAIEAADAQVESAIDAYKAAYDQAEAAYNKTNQIIGEIKNFDGNFELSCAGNETNDPQEPNVNTVQSTLSTPSSNDDDTNNTTPDTKTKKELESSKTKGLNAIANTIGKTDKELNKKGPAEKREYVRILKSEHPTLSPYIEKLAHFQPLSEHIGSSVLAYTPDKSSLLLEDWDNPTIGSNLTPTAIRRNLQEKMRPELFDAIERSYIALNTELLNNLPNEFISERWNGGNNQSWGYHLAGDWLFNRDHMTLTDSDQVAHKVGILFAQTLGEQAPMVNYYHPIRDNITIENNLFSVEEEPNLPPLTIDKRKNISRLPFKLVNNNSLNPAKPEES